MMRPRPGKVLVLPDKPEENKGGIIIPEAAKRDTNRGIVIAIGKDIKDVEVDDRVLFAKHNVVAMDYQKKLYVMVNIEDIFAKL